MSIKFDTKNLHKVSSKHGLKKSDLHLEKKKVKRLIESVDKRGQNFYKIVAETEPLEQVLEFANQRKGKYDHIVVIGIGGSALGAICLKNSLGHLFDGEVPKKKWPILHVLDNVDPVLVSELESILDLKKTLFIVVSKSGNTAEALGPFLYFRDLVEKKSLNLKDHFVAITHSGSGVLFDLTKKDKIPVVEHGPVGGRFSVLSSVGLLPAALIGIDIKSLLKGAQEMRDSFLDTNSKNNPSLQLARMQYLLNRKGKSITVMMPYAQKLASLADWYRQLLAESIGKEKNDHGHRVNIGLTPVKALGTTDQHSQAQLYNEGPNDKFLIFVHVKDLGQMVTIPTGFRGDKRLSYIQGASFNDLIDAEREGTASALTKRDRPNITISIDKLDEYHLGALFMLFEGSIAFLGELFGINAYDQPGVELAKKLTVVNLKKKRKK